jgi:YegS/Rv2252/BmrU family lipid kinase
MMLVVYNPTAGRRRVGRLWRVLDTLVMAGIRVELAETRWAGHATQLARQAAERGQRLVVAAGGDGTIAEVAAGIEGSDSRLGMIPLGTANVLARELALPFAPQAIAAALGQGRTCRIWPGRMQGADGAALPRNGLFVQMLGAGFDAQVVHRIPLPLKRHLGAMAYVVQAARELWRYPFRPIRVLVDGVAHEAASAIVTKGRLYGGRHVLAPDMAPTRPGFAVVLFDRTGPLQALRYGLALPTGILSKLPGVRLLPARTVSIEGDAVPVQTDGDIGGCAPMHVTEVPLPISVVIG